MRSERYKQVFVIREDNAEAFQDKLNDVLDRVADPEIIFDNNRSFTCYVTYKVRKDVPEDLIELFELLDGERHYCEECPHFVKSKDNRRKWGSYSLKAMKTRLYSKACEHFYVWRMKHLEELQKQYREIPFQIEG